jgi:ABC-2 type transport system ATP-binding protein
VPAALSALPLELSKDGSELTYTYDAQGARIGIVELLKGLGDAGIQFKDLHTTQSSLEDIFVSLVRDGSKDS